jgi:hypothetical protein
MQLIMHSKNTFIVSNVRCMLYLYTGRVFLPPYRVLKGYFFLETYHGKKTESSRVLIASTRHCGPKIGAFCPDMGLHYISLFYAAAITVVKCLLWTSTITIRNVLSIYNLNVGFNILIR